MSIFKLIVRQMESSVLSLPVPATFKKQQINTDNAKAVCCIVNRLRVLGDHSWTGAV